MSRAQQRHGRYKNVWEACPVLRGMRAKNAFRLWEIINARKVTCFVFICLPIRETERERIFKKQPISFIPIFLLTLMWSTHFARRWAWNVHSLHWGLCVFRAAFEGQVPIIAWEGIKAVKNEQKLLAAIFFCLSLSPAPSHCIRSGLFFLSPIGLEQLLHCTNLYLRDPDKRKVWHNLFRKFCSYSNSISPGTLSFITHLSLWNRKVAASSTRCNPQPDQLVLFFRGRDCLAQRKTNPILQSSKTTSASQAALIRMEAEKPEMRRRASKRKEPSRTVNKK